MCYIKKTQIKHYSVNNIEAEFLVSTNNYWDCHILSQLNSCYKINVIGESQYTF